MDNAVDALKIAFAVLVFGIALSISMKVFSQAKAVSDDVFYNADKTNFYDYISEDRDADYRIVSAETIIPTLYRYYKENFNVIIKDAQKRVIAEFNLEKEIKEYNKDYTNAPWLGNANIDTKLRVDLELNGNKDHKQINGVEFEPQVKKNAVGYDSLMSFLKDKRFKETFREYRFSGKEITINSEGKIEYVDVVVGEKQYNQVMDRSEETLELVKGNTKIEIIYEEIPKPE